ncbi:MAG: phenylalanine--tRNA ligase subunit alpha [Acholeplasmatales bacterium]|nr:phenylalanine--tRNA ligase subunit alpha [Acholeplasmatales bacterium]
MFEELKNTIEEKTNSCIEDLKKADLKKIEEIRINFFSKKGIVSELMSKIKDIDDANRKEYGFLVNKFSNHILDLVNETKTRLTEEIILSKYLDEKIDVTLPGTLLNEASLHPLTIVTRDIEDYFIGLGYKVEEGPEMETDYYNFEAMNIDEFHPARDDHDSFYLNNGLLLRTHTSPVQARTMEKCAPNPINIICPGKTYRRDNDDFSHSHQFMQVEGLVVGENISFGHLKSTLLNLVRHLFGADKEIVFRPSFFPFTEPSVEVDVLMYDKDNNPFYLELLGAGMVNNKVLEMSGYDSKKFSGFAFGIGIERIAIVKYQIETIKNFYLNDLRFIKQFRGEN